MDPTGVGDMYRAGLLRGLRIGAPWPVAGRIGSVAAVFGLETLGPQPPRYTPGVSRAVRRNFGDAPRAHAPVRLAGRGRLSATCYTSRPQRGQFLEHARVAPRSGIFHTEAVRGQPRRRRSAALGIVCARWNPTITDAMLAAALDTAAAARSTAEDVGHGRARARRVRGAGRGAGSPRRRQACTPSIALARDRARRDDAPRGPGPRGGLCPRRALRRDGRADRFRHPDLRHDGAGSRAHRTRASRRRRLPSRWRTCAATSKAK